MITFILSCICYTHHDHQGEFPIFQFMIVLVQCNQTIVENTKFLQLNFCNRMKLENFILIIIFISFFL